MGVGEIYLNDIKRDGTGQGYDLTLLDQYFHDFPLPVILAGGVGNADHLLEGILVDGVDAVSTNLFNFMGDGLPNARKYLLTIKLTLHFGRFMNILVAGTGSIGKRHIRVLQDISPACGFSL